jgi:hypothetical protein
MEEVEEEWGTVIPMERTASSSGGSLSFLTSSQFDFLTQPLMCAHDDCTFQEEEENEVKSEEGFLTEKRVDNIGCGYHFQK